MARNDPFLKKLFQWRLFFVVNVLLILFLGVTLGRDYLKTHEIQKEINDLQSEAGSLQAKNLSMTELQTAIQTESYIEREARLKLGMKKPGENVVIFTSPPTSQPLDAQQQQDPSDPLQLVLDPQEPTRVANASKWWYYFFDQSAFDALKAYEN
jgi:cell division protein FtsB